MAKMTFAAYAKHRGVSPAAVTKAVKAGRVTPERDSRSSRLVIDSEKADLEWESNTDKAKQAGSNAIKERETGTEGEPQTPEPDAKDDPEAEVNSNNPAHTLAKSKARREFYNAEMARLNFEQKSAKLVEAEEVKRQAFATGRIVRESLFNIPDRLAAQLASETDPNRIHALLTDEIRKALEALAHAG